MYAIKYMYRFCGQSHVKDLSSEHKGNPYVLVPMASLKHTTLKELIT